MAEAPVPVTSEMLAKALGTNAVVVRRTMAGLREKGFVRSEKGHGGGWRLSCDLNTVTLLDIYKAVESPTLLAVMNRNNDSKCQIEAAVNTVTEKAFDEAEAALLQKFQGITLAALQKLVRKNLGKHSLRV